MSELNTRFKNIVRREREPDRQANHRGKVNAVSSPRNVDGEPNKIKQSTLKSLNNREKSELGGAKRNFNAKTKSKQGAKRNSDANQKVKIFLCCLNVRIVDDFE